MKVLYFYEDGIADLNVSEPFDALGYAIVCPERGLLRWETPTPMLRQAVLQMGVAASHLAVQVPAGGRRKPGQEYEVTRYETETSHVGELPVDGRLRLLELQERRRRRERAEAAPQRLFGVVTKDQLSADALAQMRADAEAFVADLVASAKREVVFVDPDFGERELMHYALRVEQDAVKVRVLVGAMRLNMKLDFQQRDPSPTKGEVFLRQWREVASKLGGRTPEVCVMPNASTPVFHDRFLVIDDRVLASGPSFNELGERVGLISRVHHPAPVLELIRAAWEMSDTLEEHRASASRRVPGALHRRHRGFRPCLADAEQGRPSHSRARGFGDGGGGGPCADPRPLSGR